MRDPEESRMTVIEHLEALRRVLIVICIAWGIATMVGFFVGEPVYAYVVHRAGIKELILVKPTFDANEFLSFVLGLVIAFGIVFELPVVLYALGRIGIISSSWLWRSRPYWVIGLGLLANFLMPGGDPLTPLILFVPLYVFYEGTALLLRVSGH